MARSARSRRPRDPAEIVRTIGELVRTLAGTETVEAVGVSAAGFVDKARAMVVFAPNLAWRDEPLKRFLEEELDLPVVVENDANAAAWGEFTFGAGEDVEDLLMLTIGTGVGGGVVHRRRAGARWLRHGRRGRPHHDGPRWCAVRVRQPRLPGVLRLGQRARAGLPRARGRRPRGRPKELVARAGGDPTKITGPLVTEAAQDGDPFAIARLAELGDWLGQGVATLTAVLDPNVVVIGGGVSEAGDLLLDPIRDSFERHVTGRGHRPMLEIRQALLGNAGGMIGVADLARRR